MIIYIQKIKDINWFFLVLLLNKESLNLVGWEPQNSHTQKVVVSGANFP